MTQIDTNRPVLIQVSIDTSGFTSSTPQDGAVDPTTVKKYLEALKYTGTVTTPTVTNGDIIQINNVSITFATGTGLNLAGIVSTINTLTSVHHVVASAVSTRLQLVNEDEYESYGINVTGLTAVLTEIGFVTPTIASIYSQVSTFNNSLAKSRANARWNLLTKLLSFENSPLAISNIVKTAEGPDTPPTAISFTVTYPRYETIYTYDELNNNVLIFGLPAVKRMVARALCASQTIVVPVIDPTSVLAGDGTSTFARGDRVVTLVVGNLASSLSAAEGVTTVTATALGR